MKRPRLTQREQGIRFAEISSIVGLCAVLASDQLDLFDHRSTRLREWVSVRLAVLEAQFS